MWMNEIIQKMCRMRKRTVQEWKYRGNELVMGKHFQWAEGARRTYRDSREGMNGQRGQPWEQRAMPAKTVTH